MSPLDVAPGKNSTLRGGYNIFTLSGDVRTSNDTEYLDTDTGNTFTAVSAIVEVRSTGDVRALEVVDFRAVHIRNTRCSVTPSNSTTA